jgi:hypothetical protein
VKRRKTRRRGGGPLVKKYTKSLNIDPYLGSLLKTLSTDEITVLVQTYFAKFGNPTLMPEYVGAKVEDEILQVTIYPLDQKHISKLNEMTSDNLIRTHELYGEIGKVTFKMYFEVKDLIILRANIDYIQNYIWKNIRLSIFENLTKEQSDLFEFQLELSENLFAFVVTVKSTNFTFSDVYRPFVVNVLSELSHEFFYTSVAKVIDFLKNQK